MKLKSYNILFRLFSFLSDKTDGAPLFVKYKLLLGTLIIGVTSTSAQTQKQVMTNDTILTERPTSAEITCYKPAPPPQKVNVSDLVKIEGCVKDSIGNPIIGVVVSVKDTTNATLSDLDGNFRLNAKLSDLIVFSFIGHLTKEILASEMREPTTIVMEEDTLEVSCYIVIVDPVKRQLPQIENIEIQDNQVQGRVTDEYKHPILGVQIKVKGSNIGAVSDENGNFRIEANNKDILEFSFVGFKKQEMLVSKIKDKEENIVLKEDDNILCYEVVVVGLPNPWDDIYAPGAKPITKLSYNEIYKKPLSPVGDLNAFEKWVQSNFSIVNR